MREIHQNRFLAVAAPFFFVVAGGLVAPWIMAEEFPQAEISSKFIRAKLYLPNAERGYYRGSRFDWSGVIASLEYKGHSFFGVWFPRYDPYLHDAITGPVEEFRSGGSELGNALGFNEAKPGETFLKIGVGVLRRPDDAPYSFARRYDILNPGHWVSRPEADRVEFVQELSDDLGYRYHYEKTVRLSSKQPELILEHRLKNMGRRTIETDVYNHDFFVIDGQPTGPDFVVTFPFQPKAVADLKGLAEIRGNEWHYLRELQRGESVESVLTGFSDNVKDNEIRVENRKTGVGIREIGDRPLATINFWSIRTTLCPEAYIHMKIEPGQEFKWSIRYEF
jgi:hypothetical protein